MTSYQMGISLQPSMVSLTSEICFSHTLLQVMRFLELVRAFAVLLQGILILSHGL